jgi:hypothetical protein
LGVFYSLAVPIWEANDEWGHYEFVRYVAREHRLPPPGTKLIEWNDEAHQPPLYYLLSGLATSWIDASDDLKPWKNEYRFTPIRGISKALPTKEAAIFPYRGTVLSIHVARLVSVLLSTVTVWATYLIGCTAFPTRRDIALGATAINAFWPQFLFIGSMVTNDIMVTLCSSFFLLFLLSILIHGPRALDMLGLGLSLGGALLSKSSGAALIPLACLGLVTAVIRRVRKRGLSISILGGVLFFLIGAGLISAWWSQGLWDRYRGHVGRAVSLLLHPSSIARLHWNILPDTLPYGFRTFWACFGWDNIYVEEQVYQFWALVCLLASIGLLIFLVRSKARSARSTAIALILHASLIISAPIYVMLGHGRYYALQGRFSLPAASSVSLLLSLGLASLAPKRFGKALAASVGAVMFAYALLVPFRYILPAYAKPTLLSPDAIQGLDHPLRLHFRDRIALVGYELDSTTVTPGGDAPIAQYTGPRGLYYHNGKAVTPSSDVPVPLFPVTLYWCCLGEMEPDYVLTLRILGWDDSVYAMLQTHPYQGNFPTSLWKKGDCFRETYWMRIEASETTRTLARVSVSFFEDDGDDHDEDDPLEYLPVRDPRAGPLGRSGLLGRIKIAGTPLRSVPSHEVSFQVGDRISLIGYDLPSSKVLAGGDMKLTLYWEVWDQVVEDYTVLVHLVDANGETVAQGDGPPVEGSYPTGLWGKGEEIDDGHIIHLPQDLPSGRYQILVGLYSPDTLARLPVLTSAGEHLMTDAIPLGDVWVSHSGRRVFLPSVWRES